MDDGDNIIIFCVIVGVMSDDECELVVAGERRGLRFERVKHMMW
jgi:hypothetical protein